jgi:hypothetical protein
MPDAPDNAETWGKVESLAREYIERRGRQRPLFYAKMQRLLQADADRLRDKFATAALQGMLASGGSRQANKGEWVEEAYQWADAMLAARLGNDHDNA